MRQANAGPGGARNTGLDLVSDDTTHVAFLDSDDAWHPGHLAAALDAMGRFDADCCFATITGGESFDYHSTVEALEGTPGFATLSNEPLTLAADGLASRMLEDWSYLHLSCMVMTPLVFRAVRFDPELRLAAEDILFMNESVSMARRTILSAHTGALRGEGANIFHGITNTAPSYLAQQFNTLRALKFLSQHAMADDAGSAALSERAERARREALWDRSPDRGAARPRSLRSWRVGPGRTQPSCAAPCGFAFRNSRNNDRRSDDRPSLGQLPVARQFGRATVQAAKERFQLVGCDTGGDARQGPWPGKAGNPRPHQAIRCLVVQEAPQLVAFADMACMAF